MKYITIHVEDDEQEIQAMKMLSTLDFIQKDHIEVDPIWPMVDQNNHSMFRIIESDIGPMISHSRVSVYDVMEAHDEGDSVEEICQTYNLAQGQVKIALDYIVQNREILEPELKEILQEKAEREEHYRAIEAERKKQSTREMTPNRIKLQSLLEKSRQMRAAA